MKTVVLCPQCHAQYEVNDRLPGDSVRCHCGAMMTVPQARGTDARVVRCPSCGAARSGDAPVCAFCGSRFTSVDKGWGLICPSCFCRLPNDAQFCVECGLKIDPEPLGAVEANLPCPRCSSALQERWLQKVHIHECASCGGVWLGPSTFDTLCRDKEMLTTASEWLDRLHPHPAAGNTVEEPVRYLPCPHCQDLMTRQNFARLSGVIIDICRNDGVWMDNQELNRILTFIQGGGMERAHEYEMEEHRASQSPAFNSPVSSAWLAAGSMGDDLVRPFSELPMASYNSYNGVPRFLQAIAAVARAFMD